MFLCCISLTALLCGEACLLQIDLFRIEIIRKFCKQVFFFFFQKCIFSLSLVFVSVIQWCLCFRSRPSSSALCFFTLTQVGPYYIWFVFNVKYHLPAEPLMIWQHKWQNSLQACDWQRKGKCIESLFPKANVCWCVFQKTLNIKNR